MPSINTHFAMSYPILPAEVYMIALPRCSRSIFGIALFDASNVVRGSGGGGGGISIKCKVRRT